MTQYECLRCGARVLVPESEDRGERVCADCGGPMRNLALPQE